MAQQEDHFKKVISHAKEYGYIFGSSEIYDGLSAVYDYGQNGAELKKNIRDYWWKSMVQMHENIVGIDASIFMHPTTWKASGHVDAFNDPLIDNKDSKKRYRACSIRSTLQLDPPLRRFEITCSPVDFAKKQTVHPIQQKISDIRKIQIFEKAQPPANVESQSAN